MNLITKLSNLLYKKEKLLEMVAIFLLLSSVAFNFKNRHIRLIWSDYPFVALAIILVFLLIAIIWIQIQKQKLHTMLNDIKYKTAKTNLVIIEKLNKLSSRQREVLDHIIQGKSNKEIMLAMNIELSTLKTHINQIYKTLEIKNRKAAKSLLKLIGKDG
jgi:DNA-binding CsgD family transcriptional regulator